MIKFNSVSTKGHSTPTPKQPNNPHPSARERKVTPFLCNDQTPLSAFYKLDSSPLQVPLAIALKQITSQEAVQPIARPKSSMGSSRDRSFFPNRDELW